MFLENIPSSAKAFSSRFNKNATYNIVERGKQKQSLGLLDLLGKFSG